MGMFSNTSLKHHCRPKSVIVVAFFDSKKEFEGTRRCPRPDEEAIEELKERLRIAETFQRFSEKMWRKDWKE